MSEEHNLARTPGQAIPKRTKPALMIHDGLRTASVVTPTLRPIASSTIFHSGAVPIRPKANSIPAIVLIRPMSGGAHRGIEKLTYAGCGVRRSSG